VFVLVVVRRGAVALYKFTGATGSRDSSRNKNPAARFVGVQYAYGPDRHPKGAISFKGRRTSYVLIPNGGCLDTRSSITLVGWVYPESAGPLFHYNPRGWGVHLWMTRANQLFMRFVGRKSRRSPYLVGRIRPREWNYIAATYDHRSGMAILWLNSRPITRKRIGRFKFGLATNYAVVIGAKPGDRRYFRGRVACMQVFGRALNGREIRLRMRTCFRKPPIPPSTQSDLLSIADSHYDTI